MKKLIIGLVVGFLVALPVTVLAGYPANSNGKVIGGANCRQVIGGDGKSYPSSCNVDVYRITDGNVICYVSVGGSNGDASAISCLKK